MNKHLTYGLIAAAVALAVAWFTIGAGGKTLDDTGHAILQSFTPGHE